MRLILILLFIIGSIGVGLLIYRDPGYALFSYGDVSVEMPLWLSIFLILLCFFTLFYLTYFFQGVLGCADWFAHWRRRFRARRSKNYINKGLLALSEGYFAQAEKDLVKAAKLSESPLIYYLMAARAAQAQKAHDRRDTYLKQAYRCTNEKDLAVSLTQAELQFEQGQYERCLATVKSLNDRTNQSKHPQTLKWQYKTYLALNDFKALDQILPLLKKHKVLDLKALALVEEQVFKALLQTAFEQRNLDHVLSLWDRAQARLRSNPDCITQYAKILMAFEKPHEAEQVLYKALKQNWHEKLIALYGLANGKDLKKQLAFAEVFLRTHQNNAALLLTLGRLSILNQLWGKAKDYLQASVHIQPLPETYAILANLLDQLDEKIESQACYQKGLLLAVAAPVNDERKTGLA